MFSFLFQQKTMIVLLNVYIINSYLLNFKYKNWNSIGD